MKCPVCGHESDGKFCENCGSPLTQNNTQEMQQTADTVIRIKTAQATVNSLQIHKTATADSSLQMHRTAVITRAKRLLLL